ncbi:MAG: glycogen debranching protein [Chryseolinea sp.]
MKITARVWLFVGIVSCSNPAPLDVDPFQLISTLDSIPGKPEFLNSPYVTAGDRLYIIGNQDGTFPDIGWHIDGEMGGIWDHPIKLMDGFSASLKIEANDAFCLDKADQFTNYPMANSLNFQWKEQNIDIKRFQFVPDNIEGVVIDFVFRNNNSSEKKFVFSFSGLTDLRPTWLAERINVTDAIDEIHYDENLSMVVAKDKSNPWYTAFGSTVKADFFSGESMPCIPSKRKGLGVNGTLSYTVTLQPNEAKIIPIYIAGSGQSEDALLHTFTALKSSSANKLKEKIARYGKIRDASSLIIPDKDLNQMYTWLKYNVDWLKRDVPGQGIGLSAGLPDYPWWFGADATYALQGVLATGDDELVKNTILLLHNISEEKNGNGSIIHEVSTNGEVYNPGNVNETPQFISLLLQYYQWTGDKELIKQLYPDVKRGIKWLLEEKDADKNGYPDGSGMMEIPGLDTEMIDVAVYTQQGLASAAELAKLLDDSTSAKQYAKLADALKVKINADWWQEREHSFGDFRGTVTEAQPILEAALVRSDTLKKPWAVNELKETQKQFKKYSANQRVAHVIYHNWVVNTPLETGIADQVKGKAALEKAKTYENAFGVFVTGIDRTQEPDSVVLKSRKKTFSYAGAVMTLPTGVLAVGAANYGTPEDVLVYLEKLKRSFSYALPGSIYEVSPDFGMVTQAWNIYGVAVPIVEHFFGIHPRAFDKVVYISPNLPKAWTDVSIHNVKVGDNSISLAISQKADHREYHIQQTHGDWKIEVEVGGAKDLKLNGANLGLKNLKNGRLIATGKDITIAVY